MTKFVRKALVLLGIAIACALMLLVLLREDQGTKRSEEKMAPGKSEPARGVAIPSVREAVAPTDGAEVAPPPLGKPKIRPGPEELARRRIERLEKERLEIVASIDQMKKAGLADRHPGVVRLAERLQEIDEAQQK